MSIAKHLYEQHIAHGRKIVKSPSRILWDGSTGKARCPSCPWSIQYTKDEGIPTSCPRCGSLLIHG